MWLLPLFSWLARTAATLFYRLRIEGRVPERGPLLLVANHPNSLLDPALVVAAADRPVRFLAKAPLFEDRRVGWLIRAVGSIPVVRRVDEPGATLESNQDMFRAAHTALAEGAAIGLFPEGFSHSDPQLKPLKTGAARIALGARNVAELQIVPVGLVFRGAQKAVFRSQALVILGEPLAWDDLRPASQVDSTHGDGAALDATAVRELTQRIDAALRRVSINAERLEDLPVLECAEAIWRSEHTAEDLLTESQRVERLRIATDLLAQQRRPYQVPEEPKEPEGSGEAREVNLVERIAEHQQRLDALGLDATGVSSEISWFQALRWTLTRIHLLGIPALLLAAIGFLAFWVPFHLTGRWVRRLRLPTDQVSTNKLLFGAIIYTLWLGFLSGAVAILVGRHHLLAGLAAGLLTIAFLVLCGVLGLLVRERWRASARDVRRFLALTTRRRLVSELASEQAQIAREIDELVRAADPRMGTTA